MSVFYSVTLSSCFSSELPLHRHPFYLSLPGFIFFYDESLDLLNFLLHLSIALPIQQNHILEFFQSSKLLFLYFFVNGKAMPICDFDATAFIESNLGCPQCCHAVSLGLLLVSGGRIFPLPI